jgi:hypothetical protein
MENIQKIIGELFKVHNTWGLMNKPECKEQFLTKVLNKLKSEIKIHCNIGRVSKSYYFMDEENTYFCYVTKQGIIKVVLNQRLNINRGTWFKIHEIKIV